MKKILAFLTVIVAPLLVPAVAFAHVVVTPDQVGVAKTQVFTVSVPTEKDVPTVGLRLVLPSGLQEVAPTVKDGWQIDTKKSSSGDDVTEISWTNGTIPVGLRDDFTFSAQVPAKATNLQWKAYQTYQDGSVVSWDQTPSNGDDAKGDKGPYSTTKIVDDLASSGGASKTSDVGPYVVGGLGLLVGLIALFTKRKSA